MEGVTSRQNELLLKHMEHEPSSCRNPIRPCLKDSEAAICYRKLIAVMHFPFRENIFFFFFLFEPYARYTLKCFELPWWGKMKEFKRCGRCARETLCLQALWENELAKKKKKNLRVITREALEEPQWERFHKFHLHNIQGQHREKLKLQRCYESMNHNLVLPYLRSTHLFYILNIFQGIWPWWIASLGLGVSGTPKRVPKAELSHLELALLQHAGASLAGTSFTEE